MYVQIHQEIKQYLPLSINLSITLIFLFRVFVKGVNPQCNGGYCQKIVIPLPSKKYHYSNDNKKCSIRIWLSDFLKTTWFLWFCWFYITFTIWTIFEIRTKFITTFSTCYFVYHNNSQKSTNIRILQVFNSTLITTIH